MKTGRKLTAFLLAVLMLAGLLAVAPQAIEVHAAESTAINLEVTYVNPLYADIVDPDDTETLADVLTAAFNEAIRTVEDTNQSEMEKITGSINMPGLF